MSRFIWTGRRNTPENSGGGGWGGGLIGSRLPGSSGCIWCRLELCSRTSVRRTPLTGDNRCTDRRRSAGVDVTELNGEREREGKKEREKERKGWRKRRERESGREREREKEKGRGGDIEEGKEREKGTESDKN